jgi:Ser-tRNA(Ala) deacylase AlaX
VSLRQQKMVKNELVKYVHKKEEMNKNTTKYVMYVIKKIGKNPNNTTHVQRYSNLGFIKAKQMFRQCFEVVAFPNNNKFLKRKIYYFSKYVFI